MLESTHYFHHHFLEPGIMLLDKSLILADKLEQAEGQLAHSRFGMLMPSQRKKEQEESALAKVTRDSSKITAEQVHGLISQVIKDILFNCVHPSTKSKASASAPDSSMPEPMVEA